MLRFLDCDVTICLVDLDLMLEALCDLFGETDLLLWN
jgi:hypothetical protein